MSDQLDRMSLLERTGQFELDVETLVRDHPPRFTNANKRLLIDAITAAMTGTLRVSQWRGSLPPTAEPMREPEVELIATHFDYPADAPGRIEWHVNFADAHLFGAYAGTLLAQDELQVLEHPVLGSLREALVAGGGIGGVSTRTRLLDGEPTPVLVRGVPRAIALDTSNGLYGNGFARADADRVRSAASYLDPPTISNILAMEAPPGGYGTYGIDTIADVLRTACIGFGACVEDSGSDVGVIHTGGWGTGAYGGNPVLMALLQLCAARLVGVERLVYHSLRGPAAFSQARDLLDGLPWHGSVDALIEAVRDLGFRWGLSDGT